MRVSRAGKFIKFEQVMQVEVAVADMLDQQRAETDKVDIIRIEMSIKISTELNNKKVFERFS